MIKAHMSQMVDYNWHRSPSYVTHIMDNPVPIKLFNEKHILCISPAFVPASRKVCQSSPHCSPCIRVLTVLLDL